MLVLLVTMTLVLGACSSSEPPTDAEAPPPEATLGQPASSSAPATSTTAPTTEPAPSIESVAIADLNVLHGHPLGGAECADDDQCAAPDRVEILSQHIEAGGCPAIVTLQEVDERMEGLFRDALPQLCSGAYEIHLLADPEVSLGIDREMVLTTLPVLDESLLDLPAIPWSAHHVVLDSPLGRLDVVTTHLASGANNPLCADADCEPPCRDDDDARLCGARMIREHLRTAGGDGLRVVTGDLNAEPGEPAHQLFLDAGFIDAYAAAGHPECTADEPVGCTGGRADLDLDDPTALPTERIDYVLVRGSDGCTVAFDPADVGVWAGAPVPPVGESGVVWASDHAGVLAHLRCT